MGRLAKDERKAGLSATSSTDYDARVFDFEPMTGLMPRFFRLRAVMPFQKSLFARPFHIIDYTAILLLHKFECNY